jgi:hypothetical protein
LIEQANELENQKSAHKKKRMLQNLKKKKLAGSMVNGKVRMMTSATNEECEESDYGEEVFER